MCIAQVQLGCVQIHFYYLTMKKKSHGLDWLHLVF